MTHRTISFAAGAWMALTVFLGAVLAVRGVQAVLGLAPFAWWHMPTLFAGIFFTLEELTSADRAYLKALSRLLRMKAAASFLKTRTSVRSWAARCLHWAALFSLTRRPSNPKIQTEP